MTQHFSTETKAQAVALVRAGVPATQVASEHQLPERSVQRWAQACRESSPEEWHSSNDQVIHRSTELLMDGLDHMERDGVQLKNLLVLNAIRGTALDKRQTHERNQQPTTEQRGPFVIILHANQLNDELSATPTIDAKSVEIAQQPNTQGAITNNPEPRA